MLLNWPRWTLLLCYLSLGLPTASAQGPGPISGLGLEILQRRPLRDDWILFGDTTYRRGGADQQTRDVGRAIARAKAARRADQIEVAVDLDEDGRADWWVYFVGDRPAFVDGDRFATGCRDVRATVTGADVEFTEFAGWATEPPVKLPQPAVSVVPWDVLMDYVGSVKSATVANPSLDRTAQTLWPRIANDLTERSRQPGEAALATRLEDMSARALALLPEFTRLHASQKMAGSLRGHRSVQIRYQPFNRDGKPGDETVVGFAPWGVHAIRFYDGHWTRKGPDGEEPLPRAQGEVFFERGSVSRVDLEGRVYMPVSRHWLAVRDDARREIAKRCLLPGYETFGRGDFYGALAVWQPVGPYLGLIGDLRTNREGLFAGNVEESALEPWRFRLAPSPLQLDHLLGVVTRLAYLTAMPQPNSLADDFAEVGQYDEAIKLYDWSVRFANKGHDTLEKVQALERLAKVYIQLGNYDRAIENLFTTLDLESTLGYSTRVIDNLRLLAQRPGDDDVMQRTMQVRSHAMAVNRCCKLGEIAALYLELGEDDKATTYLAESERMARSLGNKYVDADLLALRAKQDLLQERWPLAVERLERALKLVAERFAEQQQDDMGQRLIQQGLAWHTFTVHEPREYHRVAMKSQTSPLSYQAFLASLLAEAYGQAAATDRARTAEFRDKARDWQTQARDAYRKCSDTNGLLVSELRLATLRVTDGRHDEAEQGLADLQQPAEQRGLFEIVWRVHALQGEIQRARGKRTEAIAAYERAAQEVESLRARIRSEPVRRGFFGSKMDIYERLIELHWENRGSTPDAMRLADEQIFRCIERAKARGLLDVVGGQPLTPKGPEVVQAQQEFPLLFGRVGGGKGLEQSYGQFLETVAERPAWQELSSLQAVQPATLAQVQAVLPPGRLLVEFAETGQHLFAVVITASNLRVIRIDGYGREAIRSDVAAFRDVLEDATADCVPLGMQLGERLLGPCLRGERGVTSVCIVPAGPLHYIPFAALVLPSRQYLAERLEVSYAASASALVYAHQRRAQPATGSPTSPRLAVVANPRPPLGFDELPFAAAEGEQIAGLLPGTQLLKGAEATEPAVLKALAESKYFHFAGHTHLPSAAPLQAALLCTEDAEADGRLEVRELFGLNLRQCDLAVLSACETRLGRWGRGDEIVGLERAFLRAGVPSVVTSLWKVDDAATQVLMTAFYRQLLERQRGVAESLREAQLAMLRGELESQVTLAQRGLGAARPLPGPAASRNPPAKATGKHPRYWAAFVVCGTP